MRSKRRKGKAERERNEKKKMFGLCSYGNRVNLSPSHSCVIERVHMNMERHGEEKRLTGVIVIE
jgi:hypothetical protein